jgi:hypothetical protein
MVTIPKFFKEGDPASGRLVLPLLPLRDIVVFPYMVARSSWAGPSPSTR